MRVRILGSAAGGAVPQWNCNCDNCRAARDGSIKPRTQSCIAVSSDNQRWLLINASPDIAAQIESFPPLRPPPDASRGSGIAGVLLTSADLDHTLGLLQLREGKRVIVHATKSIQQSLRVGLNLDAVLNDYCGIEWREPPSKPMPLIDGLLYAAFPVIGKPPRYRSQTAAAGDTIGYRIIDPSTGGRLVVVPDIAAIDDSTIAQLRDADLLLLDGTFFDDDELQRTCGSGSRASEMGHLPVGGPNGSLTRIAQLSSLRRVYVHINNTNPMLRENSSQRMAVEAAGIIIGEDGMEFNL
jgi:pyrroloquinoline quinone biosynthesis protein B